MLDRSTTRGSVVFLPNDEAFLTAYHFFRIPPEGAFGVAAATIEAEVSIGGAAWTNAHDGRLAVRGDHLLSIIQRERQRSAPANTGPSASPKSPATRIGLAVRSYNPNIGGQDAAPRLALTNSHTPAMAPADNHPSSERISSMATEQWNELVEANKAKGMSADKAVRAVALKYPKLHADYIAEYNADAQQRRAAAQAESARRLAGQF